MQSRTAQLYVTKLAAARRLLRAAIRMYFHREDELAVHTVAAAAYGILKDLKAARGANEAAFATETFLRGLLAMSRERVRDELAAEVLADDYTIKLLDDLVARLNIEPTTDVDAIDFTVAMGSKATTSYWHETNRASNFLKHANHDADAALPLSAVDSYQLVMKGMLSYESVAPDDLGVEGLVLQVHFLASHNGSCDPDDPRSQLVEALRSMSPDEQFAFSAFQLDRERPTGAD